MHLTFLLASLIYILVSVYIGWALVRDKPINKGVSLGLLLVGMLAHAALLYPYVVTLYGLNFNLFNVFSLTSLFFLLFYFYHIKAALIKPVYFIAFFSLFFQYIGMDHYYIPGIWMMLAYMHYDSWLYKKTNRTDT